MVHVGLLRLQEILKTVAAKTIASFVRSAIFRLKRWSRTESAQFAAERVPSIRNQSLIHVESFALANEIMEIFHLVVDDEEYERVLAVVYTATVCAFKTYEAKAERRAAQLKPGAN